MQEGEKERREGQKEGRREGGEGETESKGEKERRREEQERKREGEWETGRVTEGENQTLEEVVRQQVRFLLTNQITIQHIIMDITIMLITANGTISKIS